MQASSNITTTTVTHSLQPQQKPQTQQPTLVIRLQNKPVPRVSWTEQTIDNQHMNKKKSNLCCIYHRPGESSSDTCTSDDEGNALQRDRHTKHQHKKVCSKRKNKKDNQSQSNKKQGNCCGNKGPHNHGHEKKFADQQ